MLYDQYEVMPPEEILRGIIEFLVSEPEEVEITETQSQSSLIFTIDVLPHDRGKIIGKRGILIKSLTTLFHAMGGKVGKQIVLEIKD